MNLSDYINTYFGGKQADFARAEKVLPQQVTQWINKGFIVIDHTMYSVRRELSTKE